MSSSAHVVIYSLMPHAHLRGKASKFTAHYPDGRDEILLSVPKYDFNWQTTYLLKSPKLLPAGTRLVFDMTWDNSAQNPANPDPTRTVPWGDQTWDEMNAGGSDIATRMKRREKCKRLQLRPMVAPCLDVERTYFERLALGPSGMVLAIESTAASRPDVAL